jgi:hypothetical protein
MGSTQIRRVAMGNNAKRYPIIYFYCSLLDPEGRKNLVKHLEAQLKIQDEGKWNNILQSHLDQIKLPAKWK